MGLGVPLTLHSRKIFPLTFTSKSVKFSMMYGTVLTANKEKRSSLRYVGQRPLWINTPIFVYCNPFITSKIMVLGQSGKKRLWGRWDPSQIGNHCCKSVPARATWVDWSHSPLILSKVLFSSPSVVCGYLQALHLYNPAWVRETFLILRAKEME